MIAHIGDSNMTTAQQCNVVTQTVQSQPQCPASLICIKHTLQWKDAQLGPVHCSRHRIS